MIKTDRERILGAPDRPTPLCRHCRPAVVITDGGSPEIAHTTECRGVGASTPLALTMPQGATQRQGGTFNTGGTVNMGGGLS